MKQLQRGLLKGDQAAFVDLYDLLGDKLFLFDTSLGLPLPGQGGAPFSRLAEYVERPELLDRLTPEPKLLPGVNVMYQPSTLTSNSYGLLLRE